MDLEQLKHKNRGDTQEVTRPYPPENYWIPKGQWNSIASLLTHNLPLLPEILEITDALATDENMRRFYQATKQSLEEIAREQRIQQREMASQVGKMQEQNSSRRRDMEAFWRNQTEQFQESLWKKLTWILIGQSLYLSALLFILTLIMR